MSLSAQENCRDNESFSVRSKNLLIDPDGKKVDEKEGRKKKKPSQNFSKEDNVDITNNVNAASINEVNAVGGKTSIELPFDPNMPALEDYSIFDSSKDDKDDGAEADMNNLDTTIQVNHILTTRIHKDHPLDQVIRDLQSATQTRKMSKNLEEHWNKNDERGIMIKNKARLVAQGYIQEEGIDYDEVFSPVARIEAIRLFLAYASFKDFVVYQIDVKSAFRHGKIEEEVYVCQPPGFEYADFPDRVYKVEKALYGLHQALRAWYETLSTYLLDNEFQRAKIDKTLFIKGHKEAGTTTTNLTAKLPILNLGDYDLWLMRIEQLFLMTDYSLWEVIKNGNKVLKKIIGNVEHEYEPTTAEEKLDRKNEMKARGTLLMALPNKDQLKFHLYKDVKLLMEAIEKRYGGNNESKKVQRILLKQQYENFAALSLEIMDQTFDRLQKLISQLEIQGEVIKQEDMNLKLLRSLPSKWKTHALIWRNKVKIETISLDDLYNNLKIYEPELTGTNSTNSTNKVDNTAYEVSTAHTQGNTINSTTGDNLCDAVICAFLMAMLIIKARRIIKRTGRKLDINGQRVGFDSSKVECYNCHKNGHFARECRFPKNLENKGRENDKRSVTVETPTHNALIAQDGVGGYDWSYQAKEEHATNYALMAYTSSRSSSNSDSKFKTGLGYNATTPAVESFVNSSEILDKSRSDKGYHAVPSPLTGNFIAPKLNLMFIDNHVESESLDVVSNVTSSDVKTVKSKHESVSKGVFNTVESNAVRMNNFSAPIIEDWNSDDESEVESNDKREPKKLEQSHVPKTRKSGKLSIAGVEVNTVRPVITANTKAVNIIRTVNTTNSRPVNTAASTPIVKHPRPKTNA
ncbi:copia protein [Tanacetum coccineum]